jgi:tetratricopeptide (TPR) repeat protein
MKTPRHGPRPGAQPKPEAPAGGLAIPPARGVRRRRWWFPLAAALLVPLGLGALELVLRATGFGYATDFLVRHAAAPAGTLVENQRFPWRFFPPTLARHPDALMLTPHKPAGTYRIFVFGESAAEGDPAPPFGFARILQVLLRERYPGTRFEVINTAFTAISSHVIVPMARECAGLEGDLWVVYMGNNEVIGPSGIATVFGLRSLPLPAVRASLALKRTRTGQLLAVLAGAIHSSEEAAKGWGGMSMFLGQQVPADDPRLASVYANFQRNLADLLRLGRGSGAPVILSTVASNLRDSAPFGSLHRGDLTPPQLAAWDEHYQAGIAAEAGGDWTRALRAYEEAAGLDDRFADLAFRRGRGCLALGQTNEARPHFLRARDLDTLRFRTDTRLNEIIRETAAAGAAQGVRLVDAERLFAAATKDGVPGDEWFYEHVHFRFAGNYRLARAVADEIVRVLPATVTQGVFPERPWLGEDECVRRLGFSPAQEHDVLKRVSARFEEAIYRRQVNDAARRARVDQRLEELRGETKPTARRRAVQFAREAVASAPEDWVLHGLLARALGAADQPDAAMTEWREVANRVPHDATAYYETAQILAGQDKVADAITQFQRAIAVNPDFAKAHEGLGMLYDRQSRPADAVRHLRAAVRLDPTRGQAAQALARLTGRPAGT